MNTTKAAKKPHGKSGYGLSKSRLMAFRQCPKRLWLATNRPELADESGAQTAFAFGHEVGEVARQLHPGGLLIEGADLHEALAETRRALAEHPRQPLYEATFAFDNTLVRADLLLPLRTGYRLVEVKAATAVKECYYDDVAIQTWVMKNAGVPLRRIELAHLDNEFVYTGTEDYRGLLKYADVEGEISPLVKKVDSWVKAASRTLAGNEPDVAVGPQCKKPYDCPFLNYCSPPAAEGTYPLADLYRGGKLITELTDAGYGDLREVPVKLLTKPVHRTIHRAVKTGKPMIKTAGGKSLKRLGWPRRYLDFETIQFAVPIWAGTRPYQQIPFQWSCHIETKSGELRHREFLAKGGGDPRGTVIETLIEVLGSKGPIFVYSAFERCRMKELANAFPELAPALDAAIERIVDLHPIVHANYYHRDQHGSWSLKAVLPTVAPDLDYAELEVSDGGMASETFRTLLDPTIEAAEAERLRTALLQYCGRDTLGMVRIAELLQNGRA